jgi:hypothetical protein
MKIYVDADACPVTRIAEHVAKEHGIPVVLLCDTNQRKVCGIQVEAIADPRMKKMRQLDKLLDELAKGWTVEKVTSRRTHELTGHQIYYKSITKRIFHP